MLNDGRLSPPRKLENNMKKKLIRIVTMIAAIAAISIASAATSTAQPVKAIKNVRRGPAMVSGTIRWSKTYGIIPMGPGNSQAAPSPCGQFYVAATVPSTGTGVVTTSGMTLSPYYDPNYYVCNYTILNVPVDTPLYVIAGMGGTLLLPKMSEDAMYLTDAWIGGNYNKPPRGSIRTFTGSQSIHLTNANPRAVVNFELTYARKDNPK
jgi:hypothetical protein